MAERRAHPRYHCPGVMAMVRVPESTLDYYFHVADLSLTGLALTTEEPEGFPIRADTVVDIEVYTHLGAIRCRGLVARIIPPSEKQAASGYGVQVYGFDAESQVLWDRLLDELSR